MNITDPRQCPFMPVVPSPLARCFALCALTSMLGCPDVVDATPDGGTEETDAGVTVSWACGDGPLLLSPLDADQSVRLTKAGDRLLHSVRRIGSDEGHELRSSDLCGGEVIVLGQELAAPWVMGDGEVYYCRDATLYRIDETGATSPTLLYEDVSCNRRPLVSSQGLIMQGVSTEAFLYPVLLDGQVLIDSVYQVELAPSGDEVWAVTAERKIIRMNLETRAVETLIDDAVRFVLSPDGETFVWQAFPVIQAVTPIYLHRDGVDTQLSEGYSPVQPPYDEVTWLGAGEVAIIVGEFSDLVGAYDGVTGEVITAPVTLLARTSPLKDGALWMFSINADQSQTHFHWAPKSGETIELWSQGPEDPPPWALDTEDGLVRIVPTDPQGRTGPLWWHPFNGDAARVLLEDAGLPFIIAGPAVVTTVVAGETADLRVAYLDSDQVIDLASEVLFSIEVPGGFGYQPQTTAFDGFVTYRKADGRWAAPLRTEPLP